VSSTALTPGSRPSTLIADSTTVKCLTLLQAHNYAYVIPIIRWGEAIQQELSEGWSRVIQHDLTGKLDGHSWTVDFPVYIDCTYLNGKYDENGVARHGYAADAPFIDSPRDARYHYSKRFGIESSYRLFEQAIATTTTRINGTAAVRGGESPLTERLAVPSLRVCGDARRVAGVASGGGRTRSSSI